MFRYRDISFMWVEEGHLSNVSKFMEFFNDLIQRRRQGEDQSDFPAATVSSNAREPCSGVECLEQHQTSELDTQIGGRKG
jgi:hypothetical protein